jgi:hypothetical protein
MVYDGLLQQFGHAKAPQCNTRLSPSNCAQQDSKTQILVLRVAAGNPLNLPEVRSTLDALKIGHNATKNT